MPFLLHPDQNPTFDCNRTMAPGEGSGCVQILHRDIKSGNVLLSADLQSAKICDVGLAHIMGTTSLSGSGSAQHVQTTFAYAAPEMLLCLRLVPFLSMFF